MHVEREIGFNQIEMRNTHSFLTSDKLSYSPLPYLPCRRPSTAVEAPLNTNQEPHVNHLYTLSPKTQVESPNSPWFPQIEKKELRTLTDKTQN